MSRRRYLPTALGLACSVISSAVMAQTRPEDKYFDSDHIRLRYVDVGSGEPIVLIHGFGSSTEVSWLDTGILDTLSKEFRVIAMDLRGHGKSEKPHDPASYGVKMVADVARLLDHLRLRRAHIVGYSMGAGITLRFVTMYPDRVMTATLGGYGRTREWTAQSEQGVVQVATSLEQGKGLGPMVLVLWPTDESKPSADVIERLSRELLARNDALALAAVMRNYHELALTDEQVKAVRSPVLAVVGTVDPNFAGVMPFKTLLPALQVVTIEGASHPSFDKRGALKRPEFVKAVRDFVAAHRSGSN